MKHIEIETLIKKFERQIAASDELDVAAHLVKCPECRAEEAKLADFFAYTEKHIAEEVPQAVTALLLNLYQRRPSAQTTAKNGFSLASLIFDDWQMALNERYSGTDTRQMLYRVGSFDVDLRLEFVGDMCRLTGQLFPEKADATIELSSADRKDSSKLNEFGEFAFELVPEGDYNLRISIDDEHLGISKIPLHQ